MKLRIACKIDCPGSPLIIFGAYRPPRTDLSYIDELCSLLEEISHSNPLATLWLGGDLNLPDINWDHNTIARNQYPLCINERFIESLQDCHLHQLVNFPTRNNNILDIFATNKPDLIRKCEALPGISDHEIILIKALTSINYQTPIRRKVYLWNKTSFDQIKEDFTDFSSSFVSDNSLDTNIDELWVAFKSKCINILSEQVPSKLSLTKHHQPWINRSIKQLSHRKRRYYNKARSSGKAEDWSAYKDLKNTLN